MNVHSTPFDHIFDTAVKKLPSNCQTIGYPSGAFEKYLTSHCGMLYAQEYVILIFLVFLHHCLVIVIYKSPSHCQTIEVAFRCLWEAVDELLQHDFMRPSLWIYISWLFMYFITYWWLRWKILVKIVRQSGFPSSNFLKHLTSNSRRTERNFEIILFHIVIQ